MKVLLPLFVSADSLSPNVGGVLIDLGRVAIDRGWMHGWMDGWMDGIGELQLGLIGRGREYGNIIMHKVERADRS